MIHPPERFEKELDNPHRARIAPLVVHEQYSNHPLTYRSVTDIPVADILQFRFRFGSRRYEYHGNFGNPAAVEEI